MKSGDQQALISFTLGHVLLAIDANIVREVHLPVPVSPLPFVPDFMNGLININGQIMPQIDLALFLNGEWGGSDKTTTLLLIEIEQVFLAIKVTAVVEPLTISADSFVDLSNHFQNFDTTRFSGYFYHNDHPVACFQANLLTVIIDSNERDESKIDAGFLGQFEQPATGKESKLELLLVSVADSVLALEVLGIEEVVDVSAPLRNPLAPDYLLGTALVRGRPLLVISANKLLGLLSEHQDNKLSVIILNEDNCRLGFAIDQILGLASVKYSDIVFNENKDQRGFMRDGVFIEIRRFSDWIDARINAELKPYVPLTKYKTAIVEPSREFLIFTIHSHIYGVEAISVQRILSHRTITPLIHEYRGVIGTLELEGHVIPVIDLAGQMGFKVDAENYEFIIVVYKAQQWALATTQYEEIISVAETDIDPVEKDKTVFIEAFSQYNNRLLNILNIEKICAASHLEIAETADE